MSIFFPLRANFDNKICLNKKKWRLRKDTGSWPLREDPGDEG